MSKNLPAPSARRLTADEALAVAEEVVRNGTRVERGWYDDGDGESGPSGGVEPGIELGGWRVYATPNGSVFLTEADSEDEHHSDDTYLPPHYTIFGSYSGSGHWGGSGADGTWWRDERRGAIRDALR